MPVEHTVPTPRRARRLILGLSLMTALAVTGSTIAWAETTSSPAAGAVTAATSLTTVAADRAPAPASTAAAVTDNNVFAAMSQAREARARLAHARALAADRADRTKKRRAQAVAADRDLRKRIKARKARAAAWTTPTVSGVVTTPFGASGSQWSSGRHTGCDFDGNTGDAVRTVHTGVVVFAGSDGRFGNHVKIRHRNGDETWYGHLSRITVRVGQEVTTRDLIGRVGNTGNSFGAHLHFEVHRGGASTASNPIPYLRSKGLDV